MNHILKILFCLLLIGLVTLQSSAQDYVVNYQHIQTKNGLANAFVNCAMQDYEGFMWFGTNDGLCRYDGKEFRTYRNNEEEDLFLNSNAVQTIVQLDERYLLIGTKAGLSKMDLYTQKISTIDYFNKKNIIYIFIDSKKTIWIIANNQLFFKKEDNQWKKYADEVPNFAQKIITGIYEKNLDTEKFLLITEEIIYEDISLIQVSYKKYSDKNNEKAWKKIVTSPFYSNYIEDK